MKLLKKPFSEETKQNFYEHYFGDADYLAYRYDVGSYCTRKIILQQVQHTSGNMLEIGTGISSILTDVPNFERFGIDLSVKAIAAVKKKFIEEDIAAHLYVGDAERLPFKDDFFDVIVSSHVLEHIKHDDRVVKECARVLKVGGELIIFVPGRENGESTQEELLRFGHYRMYNSRRLGYLEQLTQGRLRIESIFFPHKVHNLVWNRLKNVFRWANYPIKKWIKRDGKSYEARPVYQKIFLPALATTFDKLDRLVQKSERPWLGAPFNVLVRFVRVR